MNKKVYLQVPQPCHENWDVMTPVEQGRFCKSCQKQVVDFSVMSDKEILNVMTKAAGSTCGRFTDDQLNKPLAEETHISLKPYKFFLSAFIPAFLFAGKAISQEKLKGKVAVHRVPAPDVRVTAGMVMMEVRKAITGSVTLPTGEAASYAELKLKGTNVSTKADKYGRFTIMYPEDKSKVTVQVVATGYVSKELVIEQDKVKPLHIKLEAEPVRLMGEVVVYKPATKPSHVMGDTIAMPETISGKVVNERGEPMPGATVQISGTDKAVAADEKGQFRIATTASLSTDVIASYVGYEPVLKTVHSDAMAKDELVITMSKPVKMGDVVVTSLPTTSCGIRLGGAWSVTRVTRVDTAKRFVAKVFKNEMFKVYPNPVSKTSSVHITFKEAGNYTLQILDNAGKLYLGKDLKVDAKQVADLELPSNISGGIYYIKAINSNKRKQYVDKISIQ